MELENNRVNQEKAPRNAKGQLLPGARLNPKGKPKGARHLSTLLMEALKEVAKGSKDGKSWERLLVDRIIERAVIKGDFKHAELIFDRIEGKAQQTINLEADVTKVELTPEEKAKLLKLL